MPNSNRDLELPKCDQNTLDPAMLPFRQRLANFEKLQSGVAKPISQYVEHKIKDYRVMSQNKQPILERKQFICYL